MCILREEANVRAKSVFQGKEWWRTIEREVQILSQQSTIVSFSTGCIPRDRHDRAKENGVRPLSFFPRTDIQGKNGRWNKNSVVNKNSRISVER